MADAGRIDFFVSYRSLDESWATWLAWQLEDAGYTTFLQAWDFRPGGNFVAQMQKGTTECARTLALTPAYFESGFTKAEWCAAFAHDPAGEQGLLLPVRVAECDVEGLLGQVIYVNLVGLNESEAQERLIVGVNCSRAKPSFPPRFPGTTAGARPKPGFPGTNPYRTKKAQPKVEKARADADEVTDLVPAATPSAASRQAAHRAPMWVTMLAVLATTSPFLYCSKASKLSGNLNRCRAKGPL